MSFAMTASAPFRLPRTEAMQHALECANSDAAVKDLLFLEAWEAAPTGEVAAVLRVAQIRRANPALAKAVRGELAVARRRPVLGDR